jgi:hypothetical protein
VVSQLPRKGSVNELAVQLSEVSGVIAVTSDDVTVPRLERQGAWKRAAAICLSFASW